MSRSNISLKKTSFVNEKECNNRIQAIVNNVVEGYLKVNMAERTAYRILLLIAEQWKKININYFYSTTDYYKTLAQTTDLLLKGLAYNKGGSLKIIKGHSVIIDESVRGISATVFLMEVDVEVATNLCNNIRRHIERPGISRELVVSICSLTDGSMYKLYDKK
ncbi:hypothetical protein [Alkalihalobacterium alkalinitrilicum]|uniref:hypothetical protein n=1 Tax=Alkalihalobacterium alkalinitrilicum TaxID=427920 RepID=UPI000994BD41|nr:hypothetical protein [Alkalihalobacterium alkalinitrilicum]